MRIIFLSLLLSVGGLCSGQSFKFQQFKEQEGLNNRFVYTLNQDPNGYLLVGTGEGLFRYDGREFKNFSVRDSLGDDFVSCSATDGKGAIWYGHNNGNITKYQNSVCQKIDLQKVTKSRINSLAFDPNGKLWIASQNDGLISISGKGEIIQRQKGLKGFSIYAMCIDRDGRFWVGTDLGLLTAKPYANGEMIFSEVDGIFETRVTCLSLSNAGNIIVGTEDLGIYEISTAGGRVNIQTLLCTEVDLKTIQINCIYCGSDGSLWVSSNNSGLIKLNVRKDFQYREIVYYSDQSADRNSSVHTSLVDREGNVWIGTKGNGLLKLVDDYFMMFQPSPDIADTEIFAVHSTGDSIWSATAKSLFLSGKTPENVLREIDLSAHLGEHRITSVFADKKGNLWIGTNGSGLFILSTTTFRVKPFALEDGNYSRIINQVLGVGSFVFVATEFGIYQVRNLEVVSHFTILSGLSHNVINALFNDSKERLWVGSQYEIMYVEDGVIKTIATPEGVNNVDIKCIAEDKDGNIWIGTNGNGVFAAEGKERQVITKQSGLFSDYCSSIIFDHANNLWVGHKGAISEVNIQNKAIQVFKPGLGNEIDFANNAAHVFNNDLILFGTNQGVLQYDPAKNIKNSIEPLLSIDMINISDSLYQTLENIYLPYGTYQIAFGFVGISLKKTDKVMYQYVLEGHDPEWSELTRQNNVLYNRLDPGSYVFKVRAFNSDGVGGTTTREIRINIDYAFWQKWWFILLCVFAIALAVRLVVIRRERFLRENQEFLQRELAARTHEVIEQKELLEVKNKDITDSILYAKNIQKAMLPGPDSLSHIFPDSFVYYKPRDIVSGDFYWVEKFGNKTVIACADCTGHGVPGAFMSLIGSTLLKEVTHKPWVQSPKDVLSALDKELLGMLNREDNQFGVHDSIDISVIEYDHDNFMLRAASANRPIIVYRDGVRLEYNGERFSVGGSEVTNTKNFTLHEMKLHEGDVVYMFSDGITDQFGGADGKKLKRSGLLQVLDKIFHVEMKEQRRLVRETFINWKGQLEQLDDVILVGIRV